MSRISRKAIVITLLFLGTFCNTAFAQEETILDRIVSVVDNEIVLDSEVGGLVYSLVQAQRLQPSETELEDLWYQALNELVDQKVLLSLAKRDTTIEISDEQVTQRLDSQVQGLVAQFGGEAALESQFGKSILQIKADYRDTVREQMMIAMYRDRKQETIKITPSEALTWFNALPKEVIDSIDEIPEVVRLAHIVRLPKISDAARQEAREITSTIRDSVLAGVPIEDLAKRYSDEPSAKQTGGRGRYALRELVPEFGAIASTLSPGGISQVFETRFGMHVMKLNSLEGDMLDYSHVLIKIDDSNADPTEAVEFLKVLRDSVVTHGKAFAEIAKRHSEDTQTAPLGGNILNIQTGTRDLILDSLSPRWRLTLSRMQEGQISEPVETELLDGRKARHVVKLQRRIPKHKLDFETDFVRIEQIALQEKQAKEMTAWLRTLRDKVYIKVMADQEKFETAAAL